MQGKKKYLVIALFLLLGLTTFTFANQKEELSSQKKLNNQSEKIENDKKENKSYADALKAVEEAETNPTSENIQTARDEIQTADDATETQVQELQNRITVVEESVDVAALVTEVETLAEVKETRETAKEKYITAESEVNKLAEGEVKTNLQDRLAKVSRLLNDTTAPKITGVDEEKPTNKNEIVYVSDEFLSEVTIDGTAYTEKDFTVEEDTIKFEKKVTHEGTHTVVATDKLGNQTTKTFVIDKTAPQPHSTTYSTSKPTNGDVTVTIKVSEALLEVEGWTLSEDKKSISKTFSENVNGNVQISDLAGNKVTRYYSIKNIDKVAPTGTVTSSNKNGLQSTNQDVTATLKTDEKIVTPEGWTVVTEGTEFTKVYSENAKVTLEITDLAGNKATVKFEVKRIDKVAPILTVVDPNKYQLEVHSEYVDKGYSANDEVDKDVTNLVKITYQFQAKGSSNWKSVDKVDTSKLGIYKLTYTAYDKAGNTATGTRVVEIVDTTAPVVTANLDKNGNKDITLEAGVDAYKELGATVTDNVDDTYQMTEPSYINHYTLDGVFTGRVPSVDTTTIGKYLLVYMTEDSSKNVSNNQLLESKRWVIVQDTIKPTLTIKDDAVGSNPYSKISFKLSDSNKIDYFEINGTKFDRTDAKWSDANYDNIKAALIEGENKIVLYDTAGNKTEQKFVIDWTLPEVVSEVQEYETKDGGRTKVTVEFSEALSAAPGQGWYKDNTKENTYFKHYYGIKAYSVNFSDKAGNKNTYTININDSVKETTTINVANNIDLVDKSFYNDIKSEKAVTINGNGKTVTQYITSADKIEWTHNNTYDSGEYVPILGDVFSSLNGAKVTVNNLKFKGTVNTIMLGNYETTTSNWFNTELNNVDVVGLEVVSFSTNISPAVAVYGNATLNNTNIYGTKLSALDTDPMWPVYDLAVVNFSNTVVNGGKIGSVYTWAKAYLEFNNAEVDTIISSCRKTNDFQNGGLVIGAGSKVNKIVVSSANAIITIKAGATVDTLDFNGLDQSNMTIVIEEGATVNNIVD